MPNIFTIYSQHFLIPEISETLKGSFTKFFGTVGQKIFDGKLWYPLLCIKFFDTLNFLKHWRDAHEIFRHCETKNFRRKNVIPPFSSIKLFETRNFLKNSRFPLRNFSALWDIKISTENRDMPPLIHKVFSIPEIFWKTEGFLYKVFRFGPVRQKMSTKPWCPPPSYAWKFLRKNFSETPNCSPMKYFGTVRQKLFDGKSWYPPPPLLSIKFFSLSEFFWNTEWFPGEVFSVLWDKQNFDKTVKLPPSFAWKFSIPEFFQNTEVFYEFYRHCETKIFQRSLVISPPYE